MSRLFETIKIQERIIQNPELHLERVAKSRKKLWGTIFTKDFEEIFLQIQKENLEELDYKHIYKLKIEYDEDKSEYAITPYKMRKIQKLIPVEANLLNYSLKYSNRYNLDSLLASRVPSEEKEHTDIIIVQNGRVTDSSFSNLVFEKNGEYFTPKDCLLLGTKRAKYLKEGMLTETQIRVSEINEFDTIMLINSMVELGEIKIKLPLNIPM